MCAFRLLVIYFSFCSSTCCALWFKNVCLLVEIQTLRYTVPYHLNLLFWIWMLCMTWPLMVFIFVSYSVLFRSAFAMVDNRSVLVCNVLVWRVSNHLLFVVNFCCFALRAFANGRWLYMSLIFMSLMLVLLYFSIIMNEKGVQYYLMGIRTKKWNTIVSHTGCG